MSTASPSTPAGSEPSETDLWHETQERVCALVLSLDPEALEARVPACPDWTGRDLLSHMVGLGADVVGGDEPDDHNSGWTQAQVDARTDRTAAELVAEWRALAPDLVAWMGDHGTRPLSDVVIHEQDLRSAVGVPGGRDSGGFAVVRDRMAGRMRQRVADLPGAPRLVLRSPDDGWAWASDGSPDDETGAVVVAASGFDLGRALMSRRTADQLCGWAVDGGDLTTLLPAFEVLGPLPHEPLPE